MSRVLEVNQDRTKYSLVVGDELMQKFGKWQAERNDWILSSADVSLLNAFINWMHLSGDGTQALKLINDAPRQLFLAFDLEAPPWRWVNDDDRNDVESEEAVKSTD